MVRRRLRVSSIRTATKVQERELIRKAKNLGKDFSLILPECTQECRKCPFDKLSKKLEKIQAYKDDKKKLSWFSKFGDTLAKAYAATLLLADQDRVSHLAVGKLPTGDVTYAVRGKTRKEKLIGVQHYDDQRLRLLTVLDISQKHGLWIYSTKDRMICTGRSADPPKAFVEQMIRQNRPTLRGKEGIHTCEHLMPEDVENENFSGSVLLIDWLSADRRIAICKKCARAVNSHTYGNLTQYIASLKIEDDFEIRAVFKPRCAVHCEKCLVKEKIPVAGELLERYINGEIGDLELMDEQDENIAEYLKVNNIKIFINDYLCYGSDYKAFIDSLNPTEDEKKALEAVLESIETLITTKATPNKILAEYWVEHGIKALVAVTNDEKIAEEMFRKHSIEKEKPSDILRLGRESVMHRDIISALPAYDKLPSTAKFADEVARLYRTRGKEETVRFIEKAGIEDASIKSTAYAFLLALGEEKREAWQYAQTEKDFGGFLKEYAERLLNCKPDEYHHSLQKLLRASGSTEEIELGD